MPVRSHDGGWTPATRWERVWLLPQPIRDAEASSDVCTENSPMILTKLFPTPVKPVRLCPPADFLLCALYYDEPSDESPGQIFACYAAVR